MKRLTTGFAASLVAGAACAAPAPIGDVERLSPDTSFFHSQMEVVPLPGGGYVGAWYRWMDPESSDVLAQRYGPDGAPVGAVIDVNQKRDGDQMLASVGADASGNFAVVWRSSEGANQSSNVALFARRFDSAGTPLGDEFRVDNGYKATSPDLAMAPDGRFVVTWNGGPYTFARLYGADGSPVADPWIVETPLIDTGPKALMRDDGSFVIAQAGAGISLRGYSADGTPLFHNLVGRSGSFLPSIAGAADGSFHVAWMRGSPYQDVYVARFDAQGMLLGEPVRANEAAVLLGAAVGVDAGGAAAVVWRGYDDSVCTRALDTLGQFTSRPRAVEAPPAYPSLHAGLSRRAVAYDASGSFFLVWSRYASLYGQRYSDVPDASDDSGEMTCRKSQAEAGSLDLCALLLVLGGAALRRRR